MISCYSDINTTKEKENEKLRTLIQNAQKSTTTILYPRNEDFIIYKIYLYQCVSRSDLETVAEIIKQCKSMELLEFDSCQLDRAKLEKFYNQTEETKCQVITILIQIAG